MPKRPAMRTDALAGVRVKRGFCEVLTVVIDSTPFFELLVTALVSSRKPRADPRPAR